MAKRTSSFKNMFLTLLIISTIAATALAYVNSITLEPIAKAKQQNQGLAIEEVLPKFEKQETKKAALSGETDSVRVHTAYDKQNKLIGTAVESFSNNGFSGKISIMVGFLPDGSIYKTQVLEHKETPGLGSKMGESPFKDQFPGKNPKTFKLQVKKDGGDVDAITAATISSRAFCDAVQRAYNIYAGKNENMSDGLSGATSSNETQAAKVKPEDALKQVLPEFSKTESKEIVLKGESEKQKLYYAYNKQQELVGIAVETYTEKGFHGRFTVMIGFLPNGDIYKTQVLEHKETPGFGTAMTESPFKDQFLGKNAKTFKLKIKADGGDVDAITAATISSRAFCDAMQRADKVLKQEGAVK